MKVLFLTNYPEIGASSRVRVYQYLPLLEKVEIEYKVLPRISEYWFPYETGLKKCSKIKNIFYKVLTQIKRIFQILSESSKYDIVFIQKELFSYGFWKPIKLIKWMNPNIIYDFDDAIFTSDPSWGLKNGQNKRRARNAIDMLRAAKWAIVNNEYNRNFAKNHAGNVSVIAGPIDLGKYCMNLNKKLTDKLIIGWIGSPATVKYLKLIESALTRLYSEYNFMLMVIGAENSNLSKINVIEKMWTLENEVSYLQKFDIGINPLPDDRWTCGKGGYKLLQYMAIGIPSVASPVGINSKIIRDNINGFLARTEDEWYNRLSILIKNAELRKKFGSNARKIAEQEYSLMTNFPKLLNILKKVARKD